MSLLSKGTRAAARPARQSINITRQNKRSASDHAHDHHHHGSSESAFHVEGGSATGSESFGKGFYVALAAIPFGYVAYSVSFTEDNFIKRQYRNYHAKAQAQDVLHAAALEQAISDRASVFSEPRAATRDIRYTEFFNHGSPINVSAGQGTADLRKLEAFYEERRKTLEEERVARMTARNSS